MSSLAWLPVPRSSAGVPHSLKPTYAQNLRISLSLRFPPHSPAARVLNTFPENTSLQEWLLSPSPTPHSLQAWPFQGRSVPKEAKHSHTSKPPQGNGYHHPGDVYVTSGPGAEGQGRIHVLSWASGHSWTSPSTGHQFDPRVATTEKSGSGSPNPPGCALFIPPAQENLRDQLALTSPAGKAPRAWK